MSDQELPTRITSALRSSPYRALHAVEAEVTRGQVLLRGQVRSYYEKQLAQAAVMRIDGVRSLKNEVQVA
jgi:osmotically-inducible protein OsmY